MRFSAAFTLAAAAYASAQTTTVATTSASSVPSSGCGSSIDLIIASCLTTEKNQQATCAANDWDCLCRTQKLVTRCYQNCPADPNAYGAQQSETSWCNAASAYGSMSSTPTAAATGVTKATAVAQASTTLLVSTTGSATSSPTSSSTSTTNAAISVVPAGSFLAVVFGLVALF